MSEEEGATWESRKSAVREKYYQALTPVPLTPETEDAAPTSPATPGSAPSPDATAEDPFELVVPLRSRTTGTSATATAPPATPTKPSESLMPAESTKPSSAVHTAWTVSPVGLVESNLRKSIVGPNGLLVEGLAASTLTSLLKLATARAEMPEDVVWQIAEFFVDTEDERAEGPLNEAVEFYIRNYTVGL